MKLHVQCSKGELDIEVALTSAKFLNLLLLLRHGKARFDPAQVWKEFGSCWDETLEPLLLLSSKSGLHEKKMEMLWYWYVIYIYIYIRIYPSCLFKCVQVFVQLPVARGPLCGAFADSLGDTSTISWQRRVFVFCGSDEWWNTWSKWMMIMVIVVMVMDMIMVMVIIIIDKWMIMVMDMMIMNYGTWWDMMGPSMAMICKCLWDVTSNGPELSWLWIISWNIIRFLWPFVPGGAGIYHHWQAVGATPPWSEFARSQVNYRWHAITMDTMAAYGRNEVCLRWKVLECAGSVQL